MRCRRRASRASTHSPTGSGSRAPRASASVLWQSGMSSSRPSTSSWRRCGALILGATSGSPRRSRPRGDMPSPEPVLICALSGRALAEAARAAGYAPIVLDAFGDLDTREAAAAWRRIPVTRNWLLRRRPLLAAAARLAPPPIPLVWGAGFERAPWLLAELSAGRELWGCDAATVRTLKDPKGFSATARSLGVPHPETRFRRPRAVAGWLLKRAGHAGGGHVRIASARKPLGRGWYWQRRALGAPYSGLVVGNGRDARVMGFARQLVAAAPGRPFRFGGTLAPACLSAVAARTASDAATALAAHYRVRGLMSVDLLIHGDEI